MTIENVKIIKATIDKIIQYRTNYLNSLPEFQELFLELMINDSDFYIFKIDNEEIGYAIRNKDGVLVEFYVFDKYISKSSSFFRQILKDLSITNIYCKSFDFLLLNNCLANNLPYSIIGVLYRNYANPLVKYDAEIKIKRANLSSVELLQTQDESIRELFETEKQLIDFIQNENVFEVFKNDTFVGCGMVLRTNSNRNYCDLGVWVKPSERGNGTGSQIIIHLREFALKNKMIPSCGCAIDNIASRKAIEKSGFISKYKLIDFVFE